jgi:5,6,7,8-tetrahydromethanopterin hydro-lyase
MAAVTGSDFVTEIGEAFVGEGPEAAHLNTVLGGRGGPVEVAWSTALATPRQGHAAFLAVVRPGIAAKPATLFVNKAALESEAHSELTWGAAQAGVASGVMQAVEEGTIDRGRVDDLLLIAAVWVAPQARDREAVYRNNREATRLALVAGAGRTPSVEEALDAAGSPFNPFFRPVL